MGALAFMNLENSVRKRSSLSTSLLVEGAERKKGDVSRN
jgi:hypothetical protein